MLLERKLARMEDSGPLPIDSLFYAYGHMEGTEKFDGVAPAMQLSREEPKRTLISGYEKYIKGVLVHLARERGSIGIETMIYRKAVGDGDQANSVYDAETSVRPHGKGIFGRQQAKELVKTVMTSKLWKQARRNTPSPAMAKPSKIIMQISRIGRENGNPIAGKASSGKIVLDPGFGMNIWTILHEMAHLAGYGNHGRGFRLMQVLLLAKFGGKEGLGMARKLHRTYVAAGLPVALSDLPSRPFQENSRAVTGGQRRNPYPVNCQALGCSRRESIHECRSRLIFDSIYVA